MSPAMMGKCNRISLITGEVELVHLRQNIKLNTFQRVNTGFTSGNRDSRRDLLGSQVEILEQHRKQR